jgi:phage terminase small subunit
MKTQENELIEGEVINPTTTQKSKVVKTSKSYKPTFRQIQFAKAYIEGDTMGNGTKSAIKAGYSESSAGPMASSLLRNPNVLAILNSKVEVAERVISDLMTTGESDAIRLAAAKETLDRTQGKSVSRSMDVKVNITVEDMLGE